MEGLQIIQDHKALRVDVTSLKNLVHQVVTKESFVLEYLGVILTDRDTLRRLNLKYRGGDYDTDVLSFPLGKKDAIDGEIYVSLDYAAAHCGEFGTTFEEEVRRYVVHGLLHLMGYDDVNRRGRQEMRLLEDRYLAVR